VEGSGEPRVVQERTERNAERVLCMIDSVVSVVDFQGTLLNHSPRYRGRQGFQRQTDRGNHPLAQDLHLEPSSPRESAVKTSARQNVTASEE